MWGASAPKAENAATEMVSPTAKRRVHFHGFPFVPFIVGLEWKWCVKLALNP